MLPRSLLTFTSLAFTEHSTNESSGRSNEKTEQVFPGPSGMPGVLQSSMSIRKPLFEKSLTCTGTEVVLTLRTMQIPALSTSVHSGELRSTAACAVLARLNSDTAPAKLAVRSISFPFKVRVPHGAEAQDTVRDHHAQYTHHCFNGTPPPPFNGFSGGHSVSARIPRMDCRPASPRTNFGRR